MAQSIIIAVLFLAALGYLGYIIFKSFTSKECTSGCGTCHVDFAKLEKQFPKKAAK